MQLPGHPAATCGNSNRLMSTPGTAARAVAGQAEQVSAAILVADHRSGEILAQVGAAQFADSASGGFVDMTRALRSPGSTLKPFVYALGFDEGLIHPETLIEDRPVRVPEDDGRPFQLIVGSRSS